MGFDKDSDLILEGRNAVAEALASEQRINMLYVGKEGDYSELVLAAKQKNVTVVNCERAVLDKKSPSGRHQGIVAVCSEFQYVSLDSIFDIAAKKNEPPLLVVCDCIEDPHNLGAVIRSAESAGAHGVIIPKHRGAGVTAAVVRASAGAAMHIPVTRVSGIPAVLLELKERGIWLYGLDAEGDMNVFDADMSGASAIVIGSEGSGLSRLSRERCDYIMSIPMMGKVSSLNASAAAAIALYQAVRTRTIVN